jgi:hypothetical protein
MQYQTPSAIVYTHQGLEQIYVFATGNDGRLYVRLWDRMGTPHPFDDHWRWDRDAQGTPSDTITVASGPNFIRSVQISGGAQRTLLYAFVTGSDGHLWVRYWNGFQWQWADQGTPSDTISVAGKPGVISYFRRPSSSSEDALHEVFERLYVFVRGSNGHLYANRWIDNHSRPWRWLAQGTPSHTITVESTSWAMIHPLSGERRLYVYILGSDGRLYQNLADEDDFILSGNLSGELTFSWTSLPENGQVADRPEVAAYFFDGRLRLYAFAKGKDGHLHECHWNAQEGWNWASSPHRISNTITVASEPAVIAFGERLYAFVAGSDGHLWMLYWDHIARQWRWEDRNTPPSTTVASGPAVTTYRHRGIPHLYAFVWGSDGQLHECHWNAQEGWRWGTPHDAP